jgi:competence protein ComGC
MEAKTILQKLKLAFSEIIAPAPLADTPTEYDLADGTKVMIDKLEVGGMVTMADGTAVADGDITLSDGTLVSVVSGMITVVTPVATPDNPPAMTEDMTAKFAAIEKLVTDGFAAQEQKFAAQEEKISEQQIQLGKASKVIEGLLSLTELLVEVPATQPDPEVKKSAFAQEQKTLLVEKFRELSKNFESKK